MLFGGEDEDIARQVIFEEVSERERVSQGKKARESELSGTAKGTSWPLQLLSLTASLRFATEDTRRTK